MQVTVNNRFSYLLAHNWVICRLRDSRIYLHVIDQLQCLKQLQYIMKFFMWYTNCSFDFLPFFTDDVQSKFTFVANYVQIYFALYMINKQKIV